MHGLLGTSLIAPTQRPTVQKGWREGWVMRVRKLAVKVFHPVTKLATDRVNPKGLKPSR
jgi:hypothetical protein